MAKYRTIPFQIVSGTSVQTTPTDIGPIGILVGIVISGSWTPARLALQAYMPNTGKTWGGPPFPFDNEYLDPNAVYAFVKDDQGVTITFGDGSAAGSQYLQWWGSTKAFQGIYGFRFVKVASVTASVPGGGSGLITQTQTVQGWLLVRDDY